MKDIYRFKVGDFAPSESTRSFTPEGYLKCVNVRLGKAPQVRQYYAYEFPNLEGFSADQTINVYTPAEELLSLTLSKVGMGQTLQIITHLRMKLMLPIGRNITLAIVRMSAKKANI